MPSGGTLLVIYPQDTPNTGRYKINYNFSILAFSSFTGISASKFTNPNPTTQTLGGVQAGSTFAGDYYLQDMMDLLLYPAVTPNFTSFLISAQATSLEVGETVAGSKTFTWAIANTADLQPNSIDIEDTTNSTILATNLADDGSETVFLSSVSRTTPGPNVWTISAQDTDLVTFSRTYSINWYYSSFYGVDASTTLNAAGIIALAGSALQSDIAASYALVGSGYGYICVPDSFSTPNGFRDSTTNLPIEMAGTTEGYNFFDGAFYHDSVSVTRNAIPITYRVYRTRNTISTTTIEVSLTGGTVATLQSVINAGNIANGNAAILGNFSATTFYSGNTPLNTILGNYLAGLTTYVRPGSNISTGGTALNPIISVSGSPTFTAVTANSVFATNLSGGTLYSGNTELGGLFSGLFAPISVTNTYVQEGWNIVTGGTPTRPIISVYAYPIFSSVTTNSLVSNTLVSGTITGTTFYSGSTPLNTILSQFGTINTTYVQPGSNIATGGTPTSPTVSVIGEPVFTSVTSNSISALAELSGFTIYSAGTDLSHVLQNTTTFVQSGLNITTGGTKYRPIVNLAGTISLTGLSSTTIFGNAISGNSVSATTFYSGGTDISHLLAQGASTYVQPGLNITTGGTQAAPIVNLAGSISLTAVTASSVFGTSVSATTFYSGNTDLNTYTAWRRPVGMLNSIESIGNGGLIEADNSLSFGGAMGFGGNWNIALGSLHAILDSSTTSAIVGGESNQIGQLNGWTTIIGGLSNTTQDTVVTSEIIGGEGNLIEQNISYCSIVGAQGGTIREGSLYSNILGGNGNDIFDNGYFASILGGSTNRSTGSSYSAIIAGNNNKLLNANRSVVIGGQFITGTTPDTVYVPNLSIASIPTSSSTEVLLIQSNGYVTKQLVSSVFSGGSSTYVQPGLNITTGGTQGSPSVNLAGSIVLTAVTASSVSGTSISATTFYSGSTNVGDLLASSLGGNGTADDGLLVKFNTEGQIRASVENSTTPAIWASSLGSGNAAYFNGSNIGEMLHVNQFGSGTGVLAQSSDGYGLDALSMNTTPLRVSAFDMLGVLPDFAHFYTGITPSLQFSILNDGALHWSSATGALRTRINLGVPYALNGNQITTGGTALAQTINLVSSPAVNNLIASGVSYGTIVSAVTFYSGSTDLSHLLGQGGSSTYVQPGLNITTGGTPTAPIVNLAGSISVTAVTASDAIAGSTVAASGNLSGATIYEGSTLLSAKYAPKDLSITLSADTYILALTDDSRLVDLSGSTAQNCVVPRNSAVAFPIGSQVMVAQTGAGQVTFSADTGVSILSYLSYTKLAGLYATASLVKKDTNVWVLGGNISA